MVPRQNGSTAELVLLGRCDGARKPEAYLAWARSVLDAHDARLAAQIADSFEREYVTFCAVTRGEFLRYFHLFRFFSSVRFFPFPFQIFSPHLLAFLPASFLLNVLRHCHIDHVSGAAHCKTVRRRLVVIVATNARGQLIRPVVAARSLLQRAHAHSAAASRQFCRGIEPLAKDLRIRALVAMLCRLERIGGSVFGRRARLVELL